VFGRLKVFQAKINFMEVGFEGEAFPSEDERRMFSYEPKTI
jgi:hypothetical protein